MPRTFVALPIPDAQRAALAVHLHRCAEAAPEFRWVPAESLHLTLRFIGGLDGPGVARLLVGLAAIRCAPFPIRLGGTGTFGGHRPSVVWLGLSAGSEPAAGLAAECETVCRAAGLEPDDRRFRPHVTLARSRARRGGAELPDLPSPPELDGWEAREFVLYESRLHGGRPPEYVPLERFSLRR